MFAVTSVAPMMAPISYSVPTNVVMPAEVYGAASWSMQAVTVPTAVMAVQNNVHSSNQYGVSRKEQSSESAVIASQENASAVTRVSTNGSALTLMQAPFMAQLLTQQAGSAETQALVQFFESTYGQGSEMLEQGLMVLYSGTKYLPSMAALPRLQPANDLGEERQVVDAGVQAEAIIDHAPMPVMTREPMAYAQPMRQDVTQQHAADVAVSVQAEALPVESLRSPVQMRRWSAPTPSLVKRQGEDAYAASFARNQQHLVIGESSTIRLVA